LFLFLILLTMARARAPPPRIASLRSFARNARRGLTGNASIF
jgi:hypothetical protein